MLFTKPHRVSERLNNNYNVCVLITTVSFNDRERQSISKSFRAREIKKISPPTLATG